MFAIDGTIFLLSVLLVLSGALLCFLVQAALFARGRSAYHLRAAALPALFAAVDDCVLLVDKKKRIAEVSPAFTRAFAGFALQPGSTPLRDFYRFLGCESLTGGELAYGERVYIVCYRALPGGGAACLLRDVTGQRKTLRDLAALEERLSLLQQQVERATQAFEAAGAARREANKAARRAQAASRHFLAGLARAIRVPAAALRGAGTHQTQAAARQLLDAAGNAQDMAAIESGTFSLSEADFDFGRMLARVAGTVEATLPPAQGHIAVEIADDVPAYLCADEARLARLLSALLLWAAQAEAPQGGAALAVRTLATNGKTCTLAFQLRGSSPAAHATAADCLTVARPVARAMGGALSRGTAPGGGLLLALAVNARLAEAPAEASPTEVSAEALPKEPDKHAPDKETQDIEGGQDYANTP